MSRAPAVGKRREGTPRGDWRSGSLGSFREDRLEEQVLGLPVVGRPQQRQFLEVQVTGYGRPCRDLLSRGGLSPSLGSSQKSFKEVTLDIHSLTQHLLCVYGLLGAGHTAVNEVDQSDTVYDLKGTHDL